jgi:hypothetical protein
LAEWGRINDWVVNYHPAEGWLVVSDDLEGAGYGAEGAYVFALGAPAVAYFAFLLYGYGYLIIDQH